MAGRRRRKKAADEEDVLQMTRDAFWELVALAEETDDPEELYDLMEQVAARFRKWTGHELLAPLGRIVR